VQVVAVEFRNEFTDVEQRGNRGLERKGGAHNLVKVETGFD